MARGVALVVGLLWQSAFGRLAGYAPSVEDFLGASRGPKPKFVLL